MFQTAFCMFLPYGFIKHKKSVPRKVRFFMFDKADKKRHIKETKYIRPSETFRRPLFLFQPKLINPKWMYCVSGTIR